jgi:hypothetical protein
MDGWVDGWMAGKAGLRIAYSNQKMLTPLFGIQCVKPTQKHFMFKKSVSFLQQKKF